MGIERLSPNQVLGMADDQEDVTRFIESDFRIRSGTCPNGCGLMEEDERRWQSCPACGFWTNTRAERQGSQ